MAVRLGGLALQGVLTAETLPGLARDHGIHRRDGYQRPTLPLMARLSPALASTGPTAWTLPQGVRRITRRRSRGVVRVLLQAFQPRLDGGFERGDACFEGAEILSDGNGCLLPPLSQSFLKSNTLTPCDRLQISFIHPVHDHKISIAIYLQDVMIAIGFTLKYESTADR